MVTITKEIQKLIKSNLPAATAGAMSEFISEAKDVKQDLVEAEKQNDIYEEKIKKLEADNKELEAKLTEVGNLEVREEVVADRVKRATEGEDRIDLRIALIQQDEAVTRSDMLERLVDKVFGHPSVTVSNTKTKPVMVDPVSGMAPYQNGETVETGIIHTSENKD